MDSALKQALVFRPVFGVFHQASGNKPNMTLHGTAQTKIVVEYKNIDSTTLHKIEQLKQQYNIVGISPESNGLYELTITFPASQGDIVVNGKAVKIDETGGTAIQLPRVQI